METHVLVQSQGNLPESMSHSGPAQCDSRQTVQIPTGHSDQMVSTFGCLRSDLPPSQSGPVCNQVQLQIASVDVPSPQFESVGSLSLSWENLDLYAGSWIWWRCHP